MKKVKKFLWNWIDSMGSPTNEDLMPSRFSTFKILFYLVRESVQNTVDAWLEKYEFDPDKKGSGPAVIKFIFQKSTSDLSHWFSGLKEAREILDNEGVHQQRYSEQLDYSNPDYLIIQDSNTGGIQGDLNDRTSDYWNFLLNWGRSNKRTSNLSTGGSKGVGRISFPLSSKANCVFNLTKRDDGTYISGFALLSTSQQGTEFKDSFAIFAKERSGPVWKLHNKAKQFISDFQISDFKGKKTTGTALIIPLPDEEMSADGKQYEKIKAACIENYAPLIVRNHLQPWAGQDKLDDSNIVAEAIKVKDFFIREDFRVNGQEFIDFCREALYELEAASNVIQVDLDEKCNLEEFDLGEQLKQDITSKLTNGERVLFKISFNIVQNGKKHKTFIEAAFMRPSRDQNGNLLQGVEVYYRNGMSLMEQTRHLQSSNIHAALFCHEPLISKYLNFWEDEGHSRWVQGENEKNKAIQEGYDQEFFLRPVKLCVKALRLLHLKFVDEVEEKDDTSLSEYFSFPQETEVTPQPPVPPIPPGSPSLFDVVKITGGFRIRQNLKAKALPKNGITVKARFKSEPMLKTSGYKSHDFDFGVVQIVVKNCLASGNLDKIQVTSIKKGFQVDVTGLDIQRELVLSPRSY